MLPTSLIIIRNSPSKGGYVCPESEFQNLSFLVLRRKPCCYWYFTVVFVLLFSVAAHLSEFGVTVYINVAMPSVGAGDKNKTILQFHI